MNFKAIGITVCGVMTGALVIGMFKFPTVGLPINMIIGALIMFMGAVIGPVLWLFDLRAWAPEAYLFERCRKKDIPVILDLEIGSSKSVLTAGDKERHGGPLFKYKDDDDLKLDPSYAHNTKPVYLGNGLYMFLYATSQYLPLSVENIQGLNTCCRLARENFPVLDFMNDRDLMDFIMMDRKHLAENARVMLQKYEPEWDDNKPVSQNEIVKAITDLQDLCSDTPIDSNVPMALDAAFAMNPVKHQAQDFAGAVAIIKKLADMDAWKKFNIMIYAMAFAMVVGILVFGIYVLQM
jgi:hypothetical protein